MQSTISLSTPTGGAHPAAQLTAQLPQAHRCRHFLAQLQPTIRQLGRTGLMMRFRWFLRLKCGSEKQKKSLVSCPFRKKFGKNRIALLWTAQTFSNVTGSLVPVGCGVWDAGMVASAWLAAGPTPVRHSWRSASTYTKQ